MELKNILIEKMERNKSIQRLDEQRNLYKALALVEAYEADKAISDTYGESTILKRRREDDDQEGPSAGPNRGSKRQKEGGEQASASTPSEKATKGAGGSTTGTQYRQQSASADDQPIVQTSQHPEWFSQPRKPPSPDRAWNTALPAAQGDAQSWISELAKQADARSSFNELLDTPIDFSNFIMHRLNVDTLTPDLFAGPIYELMKGSCSSLTELEYHLEEVYKATTNQLDWVNPEGQQYPHNLLQPLPLIPDNRGRRGVSHWGRKRKQFYRYAVNQESARDVYSKRRIIDVTELQIMEWHDYKHLDWISQPIDYNKHALWGVSHRGKKRKQLYGYAVNRESDRDVYSKRRIIAVTELQIMEWHDYKHLDWISLDWDNPEGQQYPHNLLQPLPLIPDNQGRHVIPFEHFINNDLEYLRRGGFAVNRESALDVYSKRRIIAVTDLKIVEWHNYKHLDWISVRRDDDKIYKFKEGDFKRLRLQDIEDMLLLLVQEKLSNLTVEEHFSFNVSLRMFTRSIVIQRRVKDLQLGVESYQKRLNLTKPDTYRYDLKRREAYTAYSNPRGFIYQNRDKKNRLMRIDELYKFSDGTLNDVRNALDDCLKGIRM
nr:hypothetical protein [Tanacetum cinerariifolium]